MRKIIFRKWLRFWNLRNKCRGALDHDSVPWPGKKMSQVSTWWLRNDCALDLELRLNKKDLWADSHKYWNYVFMHFTISDFESTTPSSASYWIKCFSNTFMVSTTKLVRLGKLGRGFRQTGHFRIVFYGFKNVEWFLENFQLGLLDRNGMVGNKNWGLIWDRGVYNWAEIESSEVILDLKYLTIQ